MRAIALVVLLALAAPGAAGIACGLSCAAERAAAAAGGHDCHDADRGDLAYEGGLLTDVPCHPDDREPVLAAVTARPLILEAPAPVVRPAAPDGPVTAIALSGSRTLPSPHSHTPIPLRI